MGCGRQTFREQVPGPLERYQRRTRRLTGQLGAVVTELAGRAGARRLAVLAVAVSSSTALRLLMRLPLPPLRIPRVLGAVAGRGRSGGVRVRQVGVHGAGDLAVDTSVRPAPSPRSRRGLAPPTRLHGVRGEPGGWSGGDCPAPAPHPSAALAPVRLGAHTEAGVLRDVAAVQVYACAARVTVEVVLVRDSDRPTAVLCPCGQVTCRRSQSMVKAVRS